MGLDSKPKVSIERGHTEYPFKDEKAPEKASTNSASAALKSLYEDINSTCDVIIKSLDELSESNPDLRDSIFINRNEFTTLLSIIETNPSIVRLIAEIQVRTRIMDLMLNDYENTDIIINLQNAHKVFALITSIAE